MLVVLIILLIVFGVGGGIAPAGPYRTGGYSLALLLLIVIACLFLFGGHGARVF